MSKYNANITVKYHIKQLKHQLTTKTLNILNIIITQISNSGENEYGLIMRPRKEFWSSHKLGSPINSSQGRGDMVC